MDSASGWILATLDETACRRYARSHCQRRTSCTNDRPFAERVAQEPRDRIKAGRGPQGILVRVLYLASQSPRRRELLARLGVPFGVLDVQVPEQRAPGESAETYVRRVAFDKAEAGRACVISQPDALVLGGDTEVVLDDVVFGKPRDQADAAAMLRRLSGRMHRVISALALVGVGRHAQAVSISEVSFDVLDEDAIARYVDSGEPLGRAGGYAIQGHAEAFITRLSGSYSTVMGLPLRETALLLREFGVQARASQPVAVSRFRSHSTQGSAQHGDVSESTQ